MTRKHRYAKKGVVYSITSEITSIYKFTGSRYSSGKQSFKDPFRHTEILSQKRARSVAAYSEKSVLFRPHAEIYVDNFRGAQKI